MSVTYRWDTSDVDRHFDSLLQGPQYEAVMLFQAVFLAQYAQVKADVHIDTGELLLSGDTSFQVHPDGFEGELSFGNEQVRYAQLERHRSGLRRATSVRGGADAGTSHDFTRTARQYDEGYVEVIKEYWRSAR